MKKYNSVRLIGRLMKKNRKVLRKSISESQIAQAASDKVETSEPKATSMVEKLKHLKNIGNMISGGKAKGNRVGDFDPQLLWEGVQEEMEHTDDVRIATEIAMDHLSEDKDYYKKLKEAGI